MSEIPTASFIKKTTLREEAVETIRFLLIASVVIIPFRMFIAQPYIVSGSSMSPTFETGQYIIVDELSYHLGDPVRGDVVIFKYPLKQTDQFIKRVVGIPNETITIRGKTVSIKKEDGSEIILEEPYVAYSKYDTIEKILGPDEYFMMGDNRSGSSDSRTWGPVQRGLIVGKAFLRLLPITKINTLPGQVRY